MGAPCLSRRKWGLLPHQACVREVSLKKPEKNTQKYLEIIQHDNSNEALGSLIASYLYKRKCMILIESTGANMVAYQKQN